jgi:hypothetical protein
MSGELIVLGRSVVKHGITRAIALARSVISCLTHWSPETVTLLETAAKEYEKIQSMSP